MNLVQDIQSLFDTYVAAYETGNAEGCAAIYTEDGQVHSPFGPPAVGRAAIAATHAEWFTEGEENKSVIVHEAEASGDLAYCLAAYNADVPQLDGPPRREAGVSLNTLRRQAVGSYLIAVTTLVPTHIDPE